MGQCVLVTQHRLSWETVSSPAKLPQIMWSVTLILWSLPECTPEISSRTRRKKEFPDRGYDWKAIYCPVISAPSRKRRFFELIQSSSALRERSLLSKSSFN